jgi:tripartite-type tricarboxylate transporter receptor subunit TctC
MFLIPPPFVPPSQVRRGCVHPLARGLVLLAATCGAVPGIAAHGRDAVGAYPARPIRMIVASPPSGPADIVARILGPRLTEAWGQAVVIDNRPGANGIIGSEMTARAAPDGYTLVMVAAGLAINPSLYSRVPYDPVRDFAAITQTISVPNLLVVHPSLGVSTLPELVSAAKARPGAIAFASAGKGTSGHLALELFQSVAGLRFVHVPHKGGAPALAEVLAGQVPAQFGISLAALPHVRSGRLRALAVTSGARTRAMPDLPTVAESGYPGFEVTGWFGLLAPARTPAGIVAKLNTESVRVLRSAEVEERLVSLGADPVASSAEAFAAYVRAETQKWARVIKATGIKAD